MSNIKMEHLAPHESTTIYKRTGLRRYIHAIVPTAGYERLRALRVRFNGSSMGRTAVALQAATLGTFARSGILSGLYYSFFSREFDREHRAVLAARSQHLKDSTTGRGNVYLLRRNIHRLEKGLIMKPPRPLFGLGMISESVRVYSQLASRHGCAGDPIQTTVDWARQVLDRYFNRVASNPIVDAARAEFDAANFIIDACQAATRIPYLRSEPANLPSIESLETLATYRRSVRWFLDRPVPREIVDRAIAVAAQAPSACNRQPFRFEVFDEFELVQKVGAIPKGTPGWLHQIPTFLVIVAKLDAFRFERDRHVPYIDGCLAAMNLINALEAQGVSSCCVNFPDYQDTEQRMAKALHLPKWERAIMCLAIGYPDLAEPVAFSQKLPIEALRRFNGTD